MSVKERREHERETLRMKILDAARGLFAEHGYEAVTMRKVANQIAYSPTAIYLYFKDKETLVWELCTHDFLTLARKFQRIAKVKDPVERLRKIGRAYLNFGLEYPNHYRLMFMTYNPYAEPTKLDLEHGNAEVDAYAFLKVSVSDAIQAGCIRHEYDDAELLAQTLWAGVHGVISLHIAKRNDAWVPWRSFKRRGEFMLDALMHGLLRNAKSE